MPPEKTTSNSQIINWFANKQKTKKNTGVTLRSLNCIQWHGSAARRDIYRSMGQLHPKPGSTLLPRSHFAVLQQLAQQAKFTKSNPPVRAGTIDPECVRRKNRDDRQTKKREPCRRAFRCRQVRTLIGVQQ